jgi:ATPase subunit of ABC transporter with duplicated ATPase domains
VFALKHIYKSFGDKIVLKGVNFTANVREVIALIGENGVGKTTLLKIILGELNPDSGIVYLDNEVIGYVPQEAILGSTILDSFHEHIENWHIDYALESVGLGELSTDTPVSSLSGGQKTRLAFAKVLACDPKPTMLLLDEPTNNLDVEGLEWLTGFLRSFRGSVVLISHDRSFVNKVATKTVELCNGELKQYGGDYDFFKDQKGIEYATEMRKYEEHIAEKKRIKHLIFLSKQRASANVRMEKAPDNDKYLWNFKNESAQYNSGRQVKAFEARLKRLGEVKRPDVAKNYNVSLIGDTSRSKLIIRSENINKSYGKKLLSDMNFEIRGSDRIHVKGPNGCGKTTMLKIIAGLIKPDSGDIIFGTQVKVGYFSQDVDSLNYRLNGFENLQTTMTNATDIYGQARSLGLTESDLRKRPSDLSRGQQAKLEFAKLLLGSNHLLILDEPTNHLDIPTRERIEVALRNYHGAILIASHDEYFLRQIDINHTLIL